MADPADIAALQTEVDISARLSRIDAAIPAGVAGECDECGDYFSRLVGGRCGFCRDGRQPPARWLDQAPTIPTTVHPEENEMEARKITIDGEALRLVDAKASAEGLSFKDAANALIEAADAIEDGPVAVTVVEEVDLATIDTSDLLDELRRRLDDVSTFGELQVQLEAAGASVRREYDRAEAAEHKLARITAISAGAQ